MADRNFLGRFQYHQSVEIFVCWQLPLNSNMNKVGMEGKGGNDCIFHLLLRHCLNIFAGTCIHLRN